MKEVPYLESRGLVVEADTSMTDAARVMLPERYARQVHAPEQRIAIAAATVSARPTGA